MTSSFGIISLINFNPSINVSFRQREASHSREITRPLEELTLTTWKLLNIITDHSAVSGERDQKEDQQQFDDHRQPHLRSWFCKTRHHEYVRRVIDILRRLLSKYARTRAPVCSVRIRALAKVDRALGIRRIFPTATPLDSNERSRPSMHVNIIYDASRTRHPIFFSFFRPAKSR